MDTGIGLKSALKLLPAGLSDEISALPDETLANISEIRLRIGRPVILTLGRGFARLHQNALRKDIDTVISRAFGNSLHTAAEQLSAGYVTYENGCRVGMAGTAATENGAVVNLKHINSVSIRVPHEIKGCSGDIFELCLKGGPSSLLIYGAPSSGKTTYLRDLARLCGQCYRTALIDERGEIASTADGSPANDVGIMTDVFDRYPRRAAIETAIRVMSPQILICDEIGSADDISSLEYAICSGVSIIASCHCSSIDDITVKPNISKLISDGAFRWFIGLKDRKVECMTDISERQCLNI